MGSYFILVLDLCIPIIIYNFRPITSGVASAVFQLSAYFVFVKVYSIPTFIALVPITPFRIPNCSIYSSVHVLMTYIACLPNKIFKEGLNVVDDLPKCKANTIVA